MSKLNNLKYFRFSDADLLLMNELKRLNINPSRFIRQAFRDKIKSDLHLILKEEQKIKSKEYCPF